MLPQIFGDNPFNGGSARRIFKYYLNSRAVNVYAITVDALRISFDIVQADPPLVSREL